MLTLTERTVVQILAARLTAPTLVALALKAAGRIVAGVRIDARSQSTVRIAVAAVASVLVVLVIVGTFVEICSRGNGSEMSVCNTRVIGSPAWVVRSSSVIPYIPVWQTSPVHSDGHSHRKPPTRSIQVPPCSHGPPAHSSMSACDDDDFVRVCVRVYGKHHAVARRKMLTV